MSTLRLLSDNKFSNKKVILRADLNLPMLDGKVLDASRVKSILPTIDFLQKSENKIILISHFGRPKGKINLSMSLRNIISTLEAETKCKVIFVSDCLDEEIIKLADNLKPGEIILAENLRFYKEEEANDEEFAKKLAKYGDIYINDTFSSSHRAHASIEAITRYIESYAGLALQKEVENISKYLTNYLNPLISIVGGSKISTKIDLLKSLSEKSDNIFVGGGMANTFLAAIGKNIGKSLYEKDFIEEARNILKISEKNNCNIILPEDVVVVKEFKAYAANKIVDISDVQSDDIIVDTGPSTLSKLNDIISKHKTLVWNGPIGAFEYKPFNIGSESLARIVALYTAKLSLVSVAGGGDVVSTISSASLLNEFTYISNAGGAFLEWLEGKELPGIKALNKNF